MGDERLAEALLHGQAVGVQAGHEVRGRRGLGDLAVLVQLGLGGLRFLLHLFGEDRLVEAVFAGNALGGADPVQRALHLAVRALAARAAVHVHGALQLHDLAVFVLDKVLALDDVRALQANLPAGGQAEELLDGFLHEVLFFDVQLAAEGHGAGAHLGMVGVVLHLQRIQLILGPVDERDLQRIHHGHGPGRGVAQRLAHAVIQQIALHLGIALGHAHAAHEVVNGGGGIAAAAHGHQRGHAGIVPAADHLFLHQAAQIALGHDGALDVQAGELDLARRLIGHLRLADEPVVQRAMDLVFQRAQRVGHALDGVLHGMLEVVHGIDAPLSAGAMVRMAVDAVHGRVAQQHVGRGHVDLGAQHAGALFELAVLHALEQVEVLLHRAVAIGAVHAGPGQRAAIDAHFLGRLVVHVGNAAADHVAGDLIELSEEIGREMQLVPLVAQPFDVGLNALDEGGFLLGGIGIVKAEIALSAVLLGNAEVDAQRLGMADVQIAVRLRREARAHMVETTVGKILVDKFLNEIRGSLFRSFHKREASPKLY